MSHLNDPHKSKDRDYIQTWKPGDGLAWIHVYDRDTGARTEVQWPTEADIRVLCYGFDLDLDQMHEAIRFTAKESYGIMIDAVKMRESQNKDGETNNGS